MQTIKLYNRNEFIMVDDEDYERLIKFNWFININQTRVFRRNGISKLFSNISIACEVMKTKGVMFDHIDRNLFNNQKSNLRLCTHSQNQMNRDKLKTKSLSSVYKGVSWHKTKQKWIASIRLNGSLIHLGYFRHEVCAAIEYNRAANRLFKEFALLNSIVPSSVSTLSLSIAVNQ